MAGLVEKMREIREEMWQWQLRAGYWREELLQMIQEREERERQEEAAQILDDLSMLREVELEEWNYTPRRVRHIPITTEEDMYHESIR